TGAAELAALGVGPADAVVGISASGRTPYVLGALGAARQLGALTVGLSCHPGSLVSAAADHAVEVVVGPEVIAGSTRLKAGAAQPPRSSSGSCQGRRWTGSTPPPPISSPTARCYGSRRSGMTPRRTRRASPQPCGPRSRPPSPRSRPSAGSTPSSARSSPPS